MREVAQHMHQEGFGPRYLGLEFGKFDRHGTVTSKSQSKCRSVRFARPAS